MSAWIGEAFTSSAGWDHLEALVDVGNRMAGSPGEREAAEATASALEAFAGNARLAEFDVQGWSRESASVETGDRPESAIGLPLSPAATVEGPLVDLEYGLPEDFESTDVEGAIVMVRTDVPDWYDRTVHRREKYFHAVRGGAAGFVYRNHVEGCLAPTGSVSDEAGGIGEIPAVGVSKEVGARLARRHTGESVTVSVEADVFDGTSQNVHAELGPETEEAILVTSHVDAHDIAEGAMDNGAGTAMLVEVAKALANRDAELDTRVRFIAFGAEEIGLVGSTFDAAERPLESVKAVVNLDGVVRDRTLSFATHEFDALGEAVDRVAERFDHPIAVTPQYQPHSDHWPYVARGVPGYHVASKSTDRHRGWGHTAGDTLDKLEGRTFREQSILVSALVADVADASFVATHKDPGVVAADLEENGLDEAMRITGDWPYEIPDT